MDDEKKYIFVEGPSYLTILKNSDVQKDIMLISDIHYNLKRLCPNSISLSSFLEIVGKTSKPDKILYLIEESPGKNKSDLLLSRTSKYIKQNSNFNLVMVDFRNMMTISSFEHINGLFFKLLGSTIEDIQKTNTVVIKKDLNEYIKIMLKYIKQLKIPSDNHDLEKIITEYFKIANTYNNINIKINRTYIDEYISNVIDDQNFFEKINELFIMFKKDLDSFSQYFLQNKETLPDLIPRDELNKYLSGYMFSLSKFTSFLSKITIPLVDVYVLALLTESNFNKNIIHAGANHIHTYEHILKESGFSTVLEAEIVNNQCVSIPIKNKYI